MRIRVQVIIEADQESAAPPHIEEVACFQRGTLSKDSLGLRLDEAKGLLAGIQQVVTAQQVVIWVKSEQLFGCAWTVLGEW